MANGHHRRQKPTTRKNTPVPSDSKRPVSRSASPQAKRRRRVLLGSMGVGVLVVAGIAYAIVRHTGDANFHPHIVPLPPSEQNRFTTLLIGTDTRPGETGGNTDVLMVASIDYQHHRIELLSIPRDTKVMFPDGTYGKINEAYSLGGVSLTDNLIIGLTGMRIPNYALTHFGGMVDIINTIGGISLNVPERMNYNTGDKQYGIINLYPGYQQLNGEQALGFVRFREDALGDIGRTVRQQEFLKALAQGLFQPSNLPKLPKLVSEFWNTLDTNMNIGNVFAIATGANQLKSFKVISETLPGAFHNPSFPGDVSYWIVNPLMAKWAAQQFFYKGIIQPNIFYSEQQVNNWTPPLPGESPTSGQTTPSPSTGGESSTSGSSGQSSTSSNGSPSSKPSTNSSSPPTGTSSSSGSTGTPQTTAVAPVPMVVSGSSANIRSGPGTTYSIIGSLIQGANVTVIGKSGDWDQVAMANGGSGYIADFLLSNTAH